MSQRAWCAMAARAALLMCWSIAPVAAAAPPPGGDASACSGGACQDMEGMHLLQVVERSRVDHSTEDAARDAFNPLSVFSYEVRHCSFGNLCAEKTAGTDFA